MGIQINGNTNNINAGIGSLSIEDINELDIVGVATAANFKTGVSNLHNVGLTLSGGQIDVGSNIKLGNAGVITATSFSGNGANLTSLPAQATIANNADNRIITGGSGTNLNGEANLTFDGTNFSVTGAANIAGTLILQPGGTAWSTTNTRPQLGRQADGELRLGAGSDSSSIVTLYTSPSAGGTLAGGGRFTTGGYEQRFSNTSTYSTTTGSRKGIYVFNSGATTNCYASLELGANNSNGHFGSTILNSIATADTTYSNHFAIQLRHGGNYYERLRIDSSGHVLPGANNTYDLGTTSVRWRNLYAQELNVTKASGNLSAYFTATNGLGTLEVGGSTGAFIDLRMPSSDDFDLRIGTGGSGGYMNVPSGQYISITGTFIPAANNTYDLGATGTRWRNIYTNDLNLSNEGGANDVDNTWGDYTIQEGESNLLLINNRNGKKYKFNLTEVS